MDVSRRVSRIRRAWMMFVMGLVALTILAQYLSFNESKESTMLFLLVLLTRFVLEVVFFAYSISVLKSYVTIMSKKRGFYCLYVICFLVLISGATLGKIAETIESKPDMFKDIESSAILQLLNAC